ncbi:MAG TPA: MotA/TolQ/ExbB proton channel family protein [Polyangiales bacterium]|nr:MotA/TolQ/ExbB proton channel family protein [Polyangiales bacterium]
MHINLLDLWASMPLPVKAVVLVLTMQAIFCVAVVVDRMMLLYQSRTRAREFAATVQPAMEAAQYDQVLRALETVKSSHLSDYLGFGLRTFIARAQAGDDAQRAAELTRRALERKGDAISRELNRGMNVLASTGSTAPFVGLLGTVLGILNAFKLVSVTGSGGIGAIGGAISEALVVTGYGLVVAIPAVLVFNWLSARIADYESGLINAGSELLDRLETATGAPAPTAGQSVGTGVAAPARSATAWR